MFTITFESVLKGNSFKECFSREEKFSEPTNGHFPNYSNSPFDPEQG